MRTSIRLHSQIRQSNVLVTRIILFIGFVSVSPCAEGLKREKNPLTFWPLGERKQVSVVADRPQKFNIAASAAMA